MAYILMGRKSGTVTFSPYTGTITQETVARSSKMTREGVPSRTMSI